GERNDVVVARLRTGSLSPTEDGSFSPTSDSSDASSESSGLEDSAPTTALDGPQPVEEGLGFELTGEEPSMTPSLRRLAAPAVASTVASTPTAVAAERDLVVQQPHLRILLCFCNPRHSNHLRLQAEERIIRQAIKNGRYRDSITVTVLPAATVDDLSRALLEERYDVLHFSGHADPQTNALSVRLARLRDLHGAEALEAVRNDPAAVSALEKAAATLLSQLEELLADEARCGGGPDCGSEAAHIEVSIPDLMAGFERGDPDRCAAAVVAGGSGASPVPAPSHMVPTGGYGLTCRFSTSELLDAGVGALAFEGEGGHLCFVRANDFAALLSAHSPQLRCAVLNACGSGLQCLLATQSIPLCIGMAGQITDHDAAAFSGGFYDALAAGAGVDKAFAEGKRRIGLHALDHFHPLHAHQSGVHVAMVRPSPLVSLFKSAALSAGSGSGAALARRADGPLCIAAGGSRSAASNSGGQEEWASHPMLGPLIGLEVASAAVPSAMVGTAAAAASCSCDGQGPSLEEENAKLKQLIQYGMRLLSEKDVAHRRLEAQLAAAQRHRAAEADVRLLEARCGEASRQQPSASQPLRRRSYSKVSDAADVGSGTGSGGGGGGIGAGGGSGAAAAGRRESVPEKGRWPERGLGFW
ncbi:unnamed protein product, partial [Phaeothamnion confervicola]